MKEALSEMNNFHGIKSRIDENEKQNSDMEYKEAKTTQSEEKRRK